LWRNDEFGDGRSGPTNVKVGESTLRKIIIVFFLSNGNPYGTNLSHRDNIAVYGSGGRVAPVGERTVTGRIGRNQGERAAVRVVNP